jgi:hypothetical protein
MMRQAPGLRGVLFGNLGLKLFSVLLATGLWYAVNVAGRDAEITSTVSVHFQGLAEDLVIVPPPVHSVRVWLAGPRAVLGTIEHQKLILNYDLSDVGEGVAEFAVDRHDLDLPVKARLVRVWPARFALRIAPRAELEAEAGAATPR